MPSVAGAGYAQRGRQVHIAQRPLWQTRRVPANDNKADGAGYGDRPADGRGGAHGLPHGHAAPAEEGDGHAAAAQSHETGNAADDESSPGQSLSAGDAVTRMRIDVEEHLRGHEHEEDHEEAAQASCGHM